MSYRRNGFVGGELKNVHDGYASQRKIFAAADRHTVSRFAVGNIKAKDAVFVW